MLISPTVQIIALTSRLRRVGKANKCFKHILPFHWLHFHCLTVSNEGWWFIRHRHCWTTVMWWIAVLSRGRIGLLLLLLLLIGTAAVLMVMVVYLWRFLSASAISSILAIEEGFYLPSRYIIITIKSRNYEKLRQVGSKVRLMGCATSELIVSILVVYNGHSLPALGM